MKILCENEDLNKLYVEILSCYFINMLDHTNIRGCDSSFFNLF